MDEHIRQNHRSAQAKLLLHRNLIDHHLSIGQNREVDSKYLSVLNACNAPRPREKKKKKIKH